MALNVVQTTDAIMCVKLLFIIQWIFGKMPLNFIGRSYSNSLN